ncbi:hypothetical protein DYQ86_25740 [Acidobacteria bacterium AB60]|nr:hypothetical protein DYQ86_25740 [Acidobacteria bacterium AB60]
MKALFLWFLAAIASVPTFAAVTVTSPANGAAVTSPFALSASASSCSSQPIVSMGYSFDNSSANTFFTGAAVATQVAGPVGTHVLHVKSWGNQGASCVTNVTITVNAAPKAASASTTAGTTDVTVSSPASGATVTSPFALSASGTLCQGQHISAFGYSFDNSATTTIVNGQTVSAQVTGAAGSHTLHIKSWGPNNAACVTDLPLTIATGAPAATTSGPVIPANAIADKAIQNLPNWTQAFDTGITTGGASSSGVQSLVPTPAVSGSARKFVTSYANYGGERYWVHFDADTAATNFVYDTWIYLATPMNDIANVEMDMNQVMSNGQTVIYGFQCDGWSQTWDYTVNTGTATNFSDRWLHSNQTCNPQAWTPNTWHHVQISYSRDNSGNVTYKSVWLDGKQQDLNITAYSSFALGWGSSLITNLQIDGMTALPGGATVYLDNLTVYRW